MKVVSNASPLVNLSRIGRISILKDLYGQIIIPEAVHREVVVAGKGMPGAVEVSEAKWIVTEKVSNFQQVHVLRYDLDAGEAESIVLAIEKNASSEKPVFTVRDCRIIRRGMTLNKRGVMTDGYSFVGILATDNDITLEVSKSGYTDLT